MSKDAADLDRDGRDELIEKVLMQAKEQILNYQKANKNLVTAKNRDNPGSMLGYGPMNEAGNMQLALQRTVKGILRDHGYTTSTFERGYPPEKAPEANDDLFSNILEKADTFKFPEAEKPESKLQDPPAISATETGRPYP